MTLIEDKLLGATGAIDFLAIPQTFKHLKLLGSVRGSVAANTDTLSYKFNDTATGYTGQRSRSSAAAIAGAGLVTPEIGVIPANNAAAGVFSPVDADDHGLHEHDPA